MADIKNMSREEIEQYLASMPKDTTEPSVNQESTAAGAMNGADGIYDISKINLNKMFVDKANEKKSYNKGSKWQAKMDELPEAARNYIYQRLNDYKSKSRPINKWDLREIEHSAKAKFGLPKSFDISSDAMFDSTMAEMLNSINTQSIKNSTEQKPAEQKPAEQSEIATNDELNAAFKKIKNKQASDADLALFSKYSEEQLKKMGFGPISIAAIKGNKNNKEATQSVNTDKKAVSSLGDSTEEAPIASDSTARKAGEVLSKGRTYKMGIGNATTYYVDGKQVDKATYDKVVAENQAAKKAAKKAAKETARQQSLNRYNEHH